MDLKTLLGELYTPEIEKKLQGKKLIEDTGTLVDTKGEDFAKQWIPKSVYNSDKESLRKQLEERDTDLESLKATAGDSKAQKQAIAELQEKNKELQKESEVALEKTTRKHAVHLELIKQGCNAPELIAPLIDVDALVKVGNDYSGADALIEPLKEKYKSNFGAIVPNGDPPPTDKDDKSIQKPDLVKLQTGLKDANDKGDTQAAVRFTRLITEAQKGK